MGKRALKRIRRSEEGDLGCIWGLISVFGFRLTLKLLPDKKHEDDEHVGNGYSRTKFDIAQNLQRKLENFIDVNQKQTENFSSGITTMRTLIEEEMSIAHTSKNLFTPESGRIEPNLRFGGNLEKNHKHRGKNLKLTSDHRGNEKPYQYKELMDALNSSNLSKDLLLKLLQDQDLLFLRHLQDLQNTLEGSKLLGAETGSSGKCEESFAHKPFHEKSTFFWKKSKSKLTKTLERDGTDSQSLSRIVLLKPDRPRNQNPSVSITPGSPPRSDQSLQCEEGTERIASNYSLKEIKRRLRRATLKEFKECQPKIEYGIASEKVSIEKKSSMEMIDNPLYREPVSYKKAKEHIAKMLNNGGQSEALPTGQVLKALGRLLSLRGQRMLTPTCSPEPDSPQILLKQDIESPPCTDIKQDGGLQVLDLDQRVLDNQIQSGKDLTPKGIMESKCMEERDHLGVCPLSSSNEAGCTSERCKEDEGTSNMLSVMDQTEERPQPATSSVSVSHSSLFPHKIEVPEVFVDILGSPSPVSVLEPFFLEDISSPGSTTFEPAGEHEHFEYVRTLLEASGMSYTNLSKKLSPSDQFLDPSLIAEARITQSNPPDDRELLFDRTDEVLAEIWERFYCFTPWLSIIRPDVTIGTVGGDLVQEVCEGIKRRLDSRFPCTLDQTISRDLDCGSWVNHRRETESIVFGIGEVILDGLIRESVHELWGW